MNKNIFKEKLKKKYGYRLTGGDTIKFGRVRFIVKVISDSDYEAKPTLIMREEDDEEEEKNEGEGRRLGLLI